MNILDVQGKRCPMPLIETKKALKELHENDSLKILIDNSVSARNVAHFLKDNHVTFSEKQNGAITEIMVNHQPLNLEKTDETAYCSTEPKEQDKYIVLMAKDRIGEGSDELGEALAGAMINTLKSMDPLPAKIIFMNSGINLVVTGSRVLKDLSELAEKGVELIVCGTCLDYFGKTEELKVGRVSNMLEILESMRAAQKVINF